MKLNVHDIEEVEKDLVYEEATADLGAELRHGDVVDFDFPPATQVEVHYHRAGDDLFFRGHVSSHTTGHCGRCLENYDYDLETDFRIVLVPRAQAAADGDEEAPDLAYYETEEIDLTPIVREQIILSLPTRPLCREDCRGLCPQCGANRNESECGCVEQPRDPRLAVLHQIKRSDNH